MFINKIYFVVLFIYIYSILFIYSQDLTKSDIDSYFKNYPWGVKSNNGEYVDYSPIAPTGIIIGFTKNGNADFQSNSGLVGSFYLENITDIVEDRLGSDGRPIYKYGDTPYNVTDPDTGKNYTLVHNSSTFYEWFHNVQCINYPINGSLYLASNPQEFIFMPTNYSYPYGTVQDPLPYFYYPTYTLSITMKGKQRINPHISIITNWLCFFFIDGVKQVGAYLEGPGDEDIYYYDYRTQPLAQNQSLKLDLFCASRYTGNNGVMDISFYNSFQNFSCSNVDSCGICGFDDTCGCNKGPVVGCSHANYECMTCSYINDCGHITNNNPSCQNVKCINNQTCQIEPISCDDGNNCTLDECSSLTGCTHTLCPNDDQCLLGTCINNVCNFKNICGTSSATIETTTSVTTITGTSISNTPITRTPSPCEYYKHNCKSNQICVEDYSSSPSVKSINQISGIPKCINIQNGCMGCNDLNCSSQGLSCKYIQENEDQNCNGKCKDINSCCSYQPTCY